MEGIHQKLELLAPARDLTCGLAAIDHGADAVYIGAHKFGARKVAGNSLADIGKLIEYAHLFHARVYVAINTLLFDDELEEAEKLIWDLYSLGADAIIVQDMGILQMNLPPIPLHASTQTDNRTPGKVKFLEEAGFRQVVLARELSLDQIREIRSTTTVPLEYFVHGALCVSYSGKCYMSHASTGRSANRGECSQPCRLPYNLETLDGQTLVKNQHLLSLKDLNLSYRLKDLIDAGISSFKIEGRLKDAAYVKNITSYYRRELDKIIEANPNLTRSSSGSITSGFMPAPEKSFSRGFSTYFLDGRQKGIWSLHTPKSLGEKIGKVVKVEKDYFVVQSDHPLNNGDGFCFFDRSMKLCGLKADVVNNSKIFTSATNGLYAGATLYRNYDHAFAKQLETTGGERKMGIRLRFSESAQGVTLELEDEDGITSRVEQELKKEPAQKPEKALEQIKSQLTKWGNTPFVPQSIKIDLQQPLFIPVSTLNGLRRSLDDQHRQKRTETHNREEFQTVPTFHPYPDDLSSFESNVLNHLARSFYEQHAIETIPDGLERMTQPIKRARVMTTKHCIRYATDQCPRENPKARADDLILKSDKTTYLLKFDCKNCEMQVYSDFKSQTQPEHQP